jgi:hypothetical protein
MPHRHTSYGLLVFVVLAAGVLLAGITWSANASPGSSAAAWNATCNDWGNTILHSCQNTYAIAISAVVPPKRPNKPAIITSPSTGQTFSTNPVTVTGTCQDGMLVKIFSNGILVGSVICSSTGHFSVPVDLVIGRNDLTAFNYNSLDQQGPAGNTVTVTLNQPPGGPGFSTELILQSVNYYRGIPTGAQVTWPITIVGGQAPYAVSIDWGDGTTEVITRLEPGPFTVQHVYKQPGSGYLSTYPLIIRASDAAGHTAYLQLTTLVNTQDSSAGAKQKAQTNTLLIIWPLWIVLVLMVTSFWLGERRMKHIMEKRLEALA